MECSCQSLINPIKELQQARSNVTWVPLEETHGPMTIIEKMLEAKTNAMKSRALKNIMPLIAFMQALAEGANAANPCHARPSDVA